MGFWQKGSKKSLVLALAAIITPMIGADLLFSFPTSLTIMLITAIFVSLGVAASLFPLYKSVIYAKSNLALAFKLLIRSIIVLQIAETGPLTVLLLRHLNVINFREAHPLFVGTTIASIILSIVVAWWAIRSYKVMWSKED